MNDSTRFPAPAYARAVLAPLFAGYQKHFRGHLMQVHRAHGIMLRERGWLTREQTAAIFAALDDVAAQTAHQTLDYTGQHEDYFFWLEDQLATCVGADVAGRLHTGRSRNDVDHAILRMVLREQLLGTLGTLHGLIRTLIRRAEDNIDTVVLAYTHNQPAQPTTFAHYLGALIEALLRDSARLLHAYGTVDCCPLGAAAITTSGFKLDRARTAELLGFSAVLENSYGCIAAIDHLAETYAALKILMLGLGRFVQDLNSWTSFETGHLRVPNAFVQISSIMPQKRNPVPIEHLRLLCSLACGQAETVLLALHNTPFTDMNDSEAPVHEAGYEAFDTAARVLDLLAALMAVVTIDQQRTRAHIDESCATITELADSLVRREGIAFRTAHEIASRLARASIAAATPLRAVPVETFREGFAEATGRAPAMSESDLRTVCTPEYFVAVRDMFGGPARMRESLAGYGLRLADHEEQTAAHRGRIECAAGLRAAADA